MKISQGLNVLRGRTVNKDISNKILLANTPDKIAGREALKKAISISNDPAFSKNSTLYNNTFNPDIRYRNMFNYTPLTQINYRNDLLLFSENDEIETAVDIIANETAIVDTEISTYPVFPNINISKISVDKQDVAVAINEYLDEIFYPKLYQYYNFKDDGLIDTIMEYLKVGKLAYEIIYDNIRNPKEIIGLQPIDPATLQKIKIDDYIYYIQTDVSGLGAGERILHENQIILIEWNKYDFGFISYVDKLRRTFNIMRQMQEAKILWFAAKSQVRMHVNLAMGEMSYTDALNKLGMERANYSNSFAFDDTSGVLTYNNKPSLEGFKTILTAETSNSGAPSVDEVIGNGPDLSETESLTFWEKLYWKTTKIPYDRIDPNSSDSWGFTDVGNMRKLEINFSKFINKIRKQLNMLFIKPIIIQLTLKEVEIGVDLSLLDNIKMEWVAFNKYEKLAELENLAKKIEIGKTIMEFGEVENAEGETIQLIPMIWAAENLLDLTSEDLKSMDVARKRQMAMLGFDDFGGDLYYDISGRTWDSKSDSEEEDMDEMTEDTNPKPKKKKSKEIDENITDFDNNLL